MATCARLSAPVKLFKNEKLGYPSHSIFFTAGRGPQQIIHSKYISPYNNLQYLKDILEEECNAPQTYQPVVNGLACHFGKRTAIH